MCRRFYEGEFTPSCSITQEQFTSRSGSRNFLSKRLMFREELPILEKVERLSAKVFILVSTPTPVPTLTLTPFQTTFCKLIPIYLSAPALEIPGTLSGQRSSAPRQDDPQ